MSDVASAQFAAAMATKIIVPDGTGAGNYWTGASGASTADVLTILLDYDTQGRLLYLGRAVPGSATSAAVWQIFKLLYGASGATACRPAGRAFANIWDSRASLSYL